MIGDGLSKSIILIRTLFFVRILIRRTSQTGKKLVSGNNTINTYLKLDLNLAYSVYNLYDMFILLKVPIHPVRCEQIELYSCKFEI